MRLSWSKFKSKPLRTKWTSNPFGSREEQVVKEFKPCLHENKKPVRCLSTARGDKQPSYYVKTPLFTQSPVNEMNSIVPSSSFKSPLKLKGMKKRKHSLRSSVKGLSFKPTPIGDLMSNR